MHTLQKQIDQVREIVINEKKLVKDTVKSTQKAIISADYNEKYLRKNYIKVMNFPRREKQDFRFYCESKEKFERAVGRKRCSSYPSPALGSTWAEPCHC